MTKPNPSLITSPVMTIGTVYEGKLVSVLNVSVSAPLITIKSPKATYIQSQRQNEMGIWSTSDCICYRISFSSSGFLLCYAVSTLVKSIIILLL